MLLSLGGALFTLSCASPPPAAVPEATVNQATTQQKTSAAIVAIPAPALAPQSPIVLGYFTNWAENRAAPCDFKTSDVNASLFTHINYSFGVIAASEDKETYELVASEPQDTSRLYAEVQSLKKQNPKLKTFLAVGGWGFNEKPTDWIFSAMVEKKERRGHFIRQSISFLREHGFDGIDIDWEFPGVSERGGRPLDKENFTALLREFRAQMQEESRATGREELLLTIASPAGEYYFQHQELGQLHSWLNWINVMTYDYHGAWEMKTGANAPLSADKLSGDQLSIEGTIAAYRAMGVPANKIVLGMATYARGWSGVGEAKAGAEATGNMPDGPCGKESLAAYQVEQMVEQGAYARHWDPISQTPFAYSAEEKTFLTYDDQESIALKLNYLKSQKLAGAMFWAIDMDDYKNGYPLISQVKRSLLDE